MLKLAASAANAAINHVQSWYHGSAAGDWVSMAIPSTGAYGSPADVIFSYPVTIQNGQYHIVEGLSLSDFDRQMIAATGQELVEERDAVAAMIA
jgi:malate dehydrogenase